VYSDLTVLHCLLVSAMVCIVLTFVTLVIKMDEITALTESFIKLG
jgi:hypothetical protein